VSTRTSGGNARGRRRSPRRPAAARTAGGRPGSARCRAGRAGNPTCVRRCRRRSRDVLPVQPRPEKDRKPASTSSRASPLGKTSPADIPRPGPMSSRPRASPPTNREGDGDPEPGARDEGGHDARHRGSPGEADHDQRRRPVRQVQYGPHPDARPAAERNHPYRDTGRTAARDASTAPPRQHVGGPTPAGPVEDRSGPADVQADQQRGDDVHHDRARLCPHATPSIPVTVGRSDRGGTSTRARTG
jgi:hypothetical protein